MTEHRRRGPGRMDARLMRRARSWLAWPLLAALAALTGCEQDARGEGAPPPASQAGPGGAGAVASARGRVDIEGGLIRLSASHDGVVASVHAEEGQRVRAGQVLARLDDVLVQRQLLLVRKEVQQARYELGRARVDADAAARELQRLEPLARDETVAAQDLDRARDAQALSHMARLAAQAALEAAQARESIARREVDERRVVAPLDGEIVQRHVRPGNGVSTLNVTPLFVFAPDAPRIVRAELEEQYLPAVAAGQAAEILLEADPARRWRGKVLRLGRIVGQRTPSEDPQEKQDNRVVEAVLSLDTDRLLIGQRVIVRFLGP